MVSTVADIRDAMEAIRQAVGEDVVFGLTWDGEALTAVVRPKNATARQQATFDPEDFSKPIPEIARELARFCTEQPKIQRRT